MAGTKRARGMTLVEIMVVIAIIGLIMGMVGVKAFEQLKSARIKETKLTIKVVEQALVHFQTDKARACPESLAELQKYLTKEPIDAWGQPLQFKCPGQHDADAADIVSLGEDRREGTPDDIKSWER